MGTFDARLLKIVNDLVPRTDSHEARWSVGRRDDQYIYSSSGASVLLETVDGDNEPPYRIKVTNNNGEVVAYGGPDEDFPQDLLERLYKLVVKRTLYIDETLDGLISELETGTPF